jgi:hypothetical protein
MVGAISSLTQAQRLAQRQAQAVRVLAMHTAKREVKEAIRREGKVKLSRVPQHEIIAMAKARLFEDGEYRAKLIAEARPIVDQWTAEGFFGKRAAQRTLERNLQHLHKPGSAEPQALPLCETHDRNGATR